jgi:positive regulator of sigma E activity
MIIASVVARTVTPQDGWVVLGGLAGLVLGFAGVAVFGRHAAGNSLYQAMILRRDGGYPSGIPLQFVKK